MEFTDPYSHIEDISEKNIIEKLGLNLDYIKNYRKTHLTSGVDYIYTKYNLVTYTRDGFNKLLTHCGLRHEVADNQPIQAIITAFPINRNMLIARLEDGREVRVRTKAKHNFVKGYKITIQRDPGGLFELKSPYPNPSKFITVIS